MVCLSAKERYAIAAVVTLAMHTGEGPMRAKVIAKQGEIPLRFLEHVMNLLKGDGLVEGVRGAQGGYRLLVPPHQITVGRVIRAMGTSRAGVPGSGEPIVQVINDLSESLNAAVQGILASTCIETLCARRQELVSKQAIMFHI